MSRILPGPSATSMAIGTPVLLLIASATLLNYVDRGSLAIAAPLLQSPLGLSDGEMGVLLSAFFWTYAPTQLLAGWLVHRFDVRYVLASGVALWSLATAFTGLAGGFASLLMFRLLLGAGESVTFPASQLLVARHIPNHQRGRANGLIGASQGVGPMLGTLFSGWLMIQYGWRGLFVGLGAVTLLWVWPWLVVSRRGPLKHTAHLEPAHVSYAAILKRRPFWGAALGHFCCNYSFYFFITWLPTFLVKAGGFSVLEMTKLGALIYGIYAASAAIAGAWSDQWLKHGASTTRVRKTFAVIGVVGPAVMSLICAFVSPREAVWFLGASGFLMGFATPMMFTIGTTLAGPRAAGRWFGAQNLAGQIAGIVAPLVTGYIVQWTGHFYWAFLVTAAVSLLGVLGWGVLVQEVEPVRWRDEDTLLPEHKAAA